MKLTLTSADRKVIAVAVVVAGICLAIGLKYFSHAFPEAAIEFRVNRDDSTPVATQYISTRGLNVTGYRHAAVFDFDEDAKVYLERTRGLEQMNTLTRGPIHLWRWSHRWFKPQQKEEFRVDVTPAGQVVGFDHDVAESAPGANLDTGAARNLAEKFLSQSIGRDLADLEFVDSVSEKRPARTDYSFTWKQKDVNLGDGSLRISVDVDGDQISGYREFVKVPEAWTRDYQKLRSRNEAANIVDEVPWIVLCIAGLVLLIQRLRKRDVPIRMALGFALVAALLFFLGQLNSFAQAEYGYRTTDSYLSFASRYVLQNLFAGLGLGALIFLLMASTEPVYRDAFPQFLSIRRYFTWHGLRTRSFFIANVVGIAMTFFFFAYQTVFYLAADKLGAWAPADVPFSDLLNTRFPWVMVLFVGFLPAVSEEIQFRAFAIPFLRKYLKSLPLAVVLAAFTWGFLHSLYPNQPFYIRGLEVGFGGIIVGLIMLRFGILATLIWHYSVDALYTAFLLLRSPNHYLMVSGAVSAGIMLVPLIVALCAYLKTGTFAEEESILNAAEQGPVTVPEEISAPEPLMEYTPLSRSRVAWATGLMAVCIALAFIPIHRFGKGTRLHLSPKDALQAGDIFMRKRMLDPLSYSRSVVLSINIDSSALHYLAERKSVEEVDQIYRKATRLVLWKVRYYRPLQKEEYSVFIDPASGDVFSFTHVLEEDAPGASLTPDQARAVAEQAIRDHGYKLEDFELQSSDLTKRKAREDYTLEWQAKPGDPRNVGDAHYRLLVEIAGDQVVGFSRHFKLPEEWAREQEASTLGTNLLMATKMFTGFSIVAVGVILFVTLVRSGRIPWRRSAKFGLIIAGLAFLVSLNRLTLLSAGYDTSKPLLVWKLVVAVQLIVAPLFVGLLGWLLIASALSVFPKAWLIFDTGARRVWRRDALIACVLSVAAAAGLGWINELLTSIFHIYAPINEDLFSEVFATKLPAADFFLSALSNTLWMSAGLSLVIYVVSRGWKTRAWWFWLLTILFMGSLMPSHGHSLPAFGVGWLVAAIPLAGIIALIAVFFRDNVLAYLLVGFGVMIAQPVVELLSQPNRFFLQNGIALALLGGAVIVWMLWPAGKNNEAAKPELNHI